MELRIGGVTSLTVCKSCVYTFVTVVSTGGTEGIRGGCVIEERSIWTVCIGYTSILV